MRITAQKVRFAAYVLCVSAIWFVDASQASLAQAPRALVGVSALKSPGDGREIAPADLPYVCPAMTDLPHDFTTTRYYKDAKSSIIDPNLKKQYDDSVAPVRNFSTELTRAADAYQVTGNLAAAKCVIHSLHVMAGLGVFSGKMGSGQAIYVQGWNLGSWAIPFLKVRDSGLASADEAREISAWLMKIATDNRAYYEAKRANPAPSDAHNNHLYWGALAYVGAAVAANDRAMFDWCMDAYREGARDIAADGTLPMELGRGQMALHYHLYALSPMVMLAEFGAANGIDLYAASNHAITRLVTLCIAGLASPAFFEHATGVAQVNTPTIESWEISWAVPYTRRFPDAKLSALLAQCKDLSSLPLGGLPPP